MVTPADPVNVQEFTPEELDLLTSALATQAVPLDTVHTTEEVLQTSEVLNEAPKAPTEPLNEAAQASEPTIFLSRSVLRLFVESESLRDRLKYNSIDENEEIKIYSIYRLLAAWVDILCSTRIWRGEIELVGGVITYDQTDYFSSEAIYDVTTRMLCCLLRSRTAYTAQQKRTQGFNHLHVFKRIGIQYHKVRGVIRISVPVLMFMLPDALLAAIPHLHAFRESQRVGKIGSSPVNEAYCLMKKRLVFTDETSFNPYNLPDAISISEFIKARELDYESFVQYDYQRSRETIDQAVISLSSYLNIPTTDETYPVWIRAVLRLRRFFINN